MQLVLETPLLHFPPVQFVRSHFPFLQVAGSHLPLHVTGSHFPAEHIFESEFLRYASVREQHEMLCDISVAAFLFLASPACALTAKTINNDNATNPVNARSIFFIV
jgi:hypothetical protein